MSVWIAIAGGGAASCIVAAAILRHEPRNVLPRASLAIILTLTAAWIGSMIMTLRYGELFSISAFLGPASLVLILLRPPTSHDLRRTLTVFSFVVLLAIFISFLAHWTGLRPFREDFQNRLPFEFLNFDYRWESFFGDANQAGTALVALILIGLYRKGKYGVTTALLASVLLLLTQSRTALIALTLGIATMYAFGRAKSSEMRVRRFIILAVAIILAILIIAFIDPSMNGRSQIWQDYLSLWQTSPFLGLGSNDIELMVPLITGLAQDAHNVFLDAFVRYGFMAGVPAIIFAGSCLWITFRRPTTAHGFPVALLIALLICFTTYTTFGWIYLTLFLWPLLLAMLITGEVQYRAKLSSKHPSQDYESSREVHQRPFEPQDQD